MKILTFWLLKTSYLLQTTGLRVVTIKSTLFGQVFLHPAAVTEFCCTENVPNY